MVSHYINKVNISRKMRSDERICQSCGKIFRYKKGRGRKPDYCKTCRIKGEANKSKCKKWYTNKGWITKRDYETPSKKYYAMVELTINESKINNGYIDKTGEFNQADLPNELGNTQLGTSPVKNKDGSIDIEYELNIIRNEKRRLGL